MANLSSAAPKPPMAHWYQCKNCGLVMHTPFKAKFGSPYICIGSGQGMCRRFMSYIGYDTCPPSQAGKVTWNPAAQLEREQQALASKEGS